MIQPYLSNQSKATSCSTQQEQHEEKTENYYDDDYDHDYDDYVDSSDGDDYLEYDDFNPQGRRGGGGTNTAQSQRRKKKQDKTNDGKRTIYSSKHVRLREQSRRQQSSKRLA